MAATVANGVMMKPMIIKECVVDGLEYRKFQASVARRVVETSICAQCWNVTYELQFIFVPGYQTGGAKEPNWRSKKASLGARLCMGKFISGFIGTHQTLDMSFRFWRQTKRSLGASLHWRFRIAKRSMLHCLAERSRRTSTTSRSATKEEVETRCTILASGLVMPSLNCSRRPMRKFEENCQWEAAASHGVAALAWFSVVHSAFVCIARPAARVRVRSAGMSHHRG